MGKKRILLAEKCESWNMTAVLQWPSSIGLAQYRDVFRENEINGSVLLELGVDDLDYMGIRALGHRKELLKQVEKLKNVKMGNKKSHHHTVPIQNNFEELDEVKSCSIGTQEEKNPETNSLLHGGVDEEKEHQAFRHAVEEWRNSQKPKSARETVVTYEYEEKNNETENIIPLSTARGGTLLQGNLDETAEHVAFRAAVQSWRNSMKSNDIKIVSYD